MLSEKTYLDLIYCLLKDSSAIVDGYDDWLRDYEEICSRVAMEGISFLTKTLPRFSKQLLRCIEDGTFTPIVGFKRRRSGPLPRFLQGLVTRVFNEEGSLLDGADTRAVASIHQICAWMKKTQFGFTEKQVEIKISNFTQTEFDISDIGSRGSQHRDLILLNADELTREVFRDFRITAYPRHGPGSVAGGERGLAKFHCDFADYLDDPFPYEDWFKPSSFILEDAGEYSDDSAEALSYRPLPDSTMCSMPSLDEILSGTDERPYAKAVPVEKDSDGPRIIHEEPKENQWLQQAIGMSIRETLETHVLTRGHINFVDQGVNRQLALESSASRKLATLDLKDASNRNSLWLVRQTCPTKLVRLLEATRSEDTKLPTGMVVHLSMFAGMGSACCFPVESLVFWALAVAAIQVKTGWDALKASRNVFVYGDDIIVPVAYVNEVMTALEICGLKVNKDKTFIHGPFRESCGMDAFNGVPITPVRLRKPVPRSRQDFSSIVSWVETSNLLFKSGFWHTAQCMVLCVEEAMGMPLQLVPEESGLFGLTTPFGNPYNHPVPQGGTPFCAYRGRWDNCLHGYTWLTFRVKTKSKPAVATKDVELLHWLVKPGQSENSGPRWAPIPEVSFPEREAIRLKKRYSALT